MTPLDYGPKAGWGFQPLPLHRKDLLGEHNRSLDSLRPSFRDALVRYQGRDAIEQDQRVLEPFGSLVHVLE